MFKVVAFFDNVKITLYLVRSNYVQTLRFKNIIFLLRLFVTKELQKYVIIT